MIDVRGEWEKWNSGGVCFYNEVDLSQDELAIDVVVPQRCCIANLLIEMQNNVREDIELCCIPMAMTRAICIHKKKMEESHMFFWGDMNKTQFIKGDRLVMTTSNKNKTGTATARLSLKTL